MKKIKCFLMASLLVLMALFTNGCNTSNEELQTIRLAEVTHSVFYAPQYVAIEQGFFEEEGIEIELIGAQGADKTMAALLSGEAEVGFMGPEASIYVYNQGSKDYAITFAQLTQRDGNFLVAKTPNPDFELEDLKGTEILGGRKGGVPLMALEYALKNAGLEIGEDVENGEVNVRTDIQFAALAGAFTGGEGDYVTLFEPVPTSLEKEGQGYVVASIGELAGNIAYTAYCAEKSYIEENPELIQAFTNAINKGLKFVEENPPEIVAEIIQPQFKEISVEDLSIVVERYKEVDTWCATPEVSEEGLNNLMDMMILAGELDERIDYSEIIDNSFAEQTVEDQK